MIRYLYSGDDQAVGLFNSPTDDQTGDWWAGTFKCGALLAMATFTTALWTARVAGMVHNQHTDFAPPQAEQVASAPSHQFSILEIGNWGPSRTPYWGVADSFFSVGQALDENAISYPLWPNITRVIAPWSYDQGGFQGESFKLDEIYNTLGLAKAQLVENWSNRVPSPNWDSTQEQALVAITKVEEEYWQNLVKPALWSTPPVRAFSDDGMTEGNLGAGLVPDDSYSPQHLISRQVDFDITMIAPWSYDQDVELNPSAITIEEDYPPLRIPPSLWPTPPVKAFTDSGSDLGNLHLNVTIDEFIPGPFPKPDLWRTNGLYLWGEPNLFVTFVAAPVIDEDFWGLLGFRQHVWSPPVQAFRDVDENNLGVLQIVLEDFYWWKSQVAQEIHRWVPPVWWGDLTLMGTGVPVPIPDLPIDKNVVIADIDTTPVFQVLDTSIVLKLLR